MRAHLTLLAPFALLVACATTQPKVETVEKAPAPPPVPPLELLSLEPADHTLINFQLKVAGKLGPGVDGKEMQWSVKEGQVDHGSGTVPIQVAADRTFTASVPVSMASDLAGLEPYRDLESVELTVNATVGGASATRTQRIRSPMIPMAKIQSVQATRSGPDTIELTYWFAIDNQNLYPLRMSGIDYKGYLDGKLVAEVSTPTDPRLKAAAMTEYTFNAQANPTNCGKDIKAMIKQTAHKWAFTGVVHYATLDVPFSLEGELNVAK